MTGDDGQGWGPERRARYGELLDTLAGQGHLASAWRPAFEAVPRHRFLPEQVWRVARGSCVPVNRAIDGESWWDLVCQDVPVVTRRDEGGAPTSSSSMPSMVAGMLGFLGVVPGARVLEIGTGTGWNAGLLSHRLGPENVTSVEVDPDIAGRAREALRRSGQGPQVVTGDGERGWARNAPYDAVIVTCALRTVPLALVEQCAPGAVLVVPVYGAGLVRLTACGAGTASGWFVGGADFTLLRAHREPQRNIPAGAPSWKSRTGLDTRCVADLGFVLHVYGRAPELRLTGRQRDGRYLAWVDDGRGSAAHADDSGHVWECGPRAVWEELEGHWQAYRDAGRPDAAEYGLTVTARGQRVWRRGLGSPGLRSPGPGNPGPGNPARGNSAHKTGA